MKTILVRNAFEVGGLTADVEDLIEPQQTATRERNVIRPNLIESDEYEWISATNLPGLIVAEAPEPRQPVVRSAEATQDARGEVVETEDGDATRFCQLPGGLLVGSAPVMLTECTPVVSSELEWMDEYAEQAAMQLPGQIVEPQYEELREAEHPGLLGLCATCVNRKFCDFPRPESGVWRCEEYA